MLVNIAKLSASTTNRKNALKEKANRTNSTFGFFQNSKPNTKNQKSNPQSQKKLTKYCVIFKKLIVYLRLEMSGNLENTKELAMFAKALGHPTRIAILKHLENQSCCFTGDLVEVFPLAQSTVSQHLKELKNAGLIQGEVKPPKIKYCINQDNWNKAKELFSKFFK